MEDYKKKYNKVGRQLMFDTATGSGKRNMASALYMPCCQRYHRWDGTGMEGLMQSTANCPLCGKDLGKGVKGPVQG